MKSSKAKSIAQIKGLCAPMMINDIDTDIIIPAQHLTQTSTSGYGPHAFARLKQADPEFVLNQAQYLQANILITGKNFGCGSSREHAVWAIQELGFAAIIAPSFADIFSNNARKNGLVLIDQPTHVCQLLATHAQTSPLYMVLDLVNTHAKTEHINFDFNISPFFQHCLTQGHSELGYLMNHHAAINNHHQQALSSHLFIDYDGIQNSRDAS